MIKRSGLWGIIVCVILMLGLTSLSYAQEHKVNLNALLEETQMMSEGADDLTIVWWVPVEFWKASFAQDPSVSKTDAENILKALGPYTIIAAVDGKIGTFGGVTYSSESYLRTNTTIKDVRGKVYKPLSNSSIDADALSLLSTMKPVLENILGPMGQNMHFLVFPGTDDNGLVLADPRKEGIMTVTLGANSFKYRLPLGSLLPPKVCPVDGEEMSGAWKYCPWHGTELKLKESD